MPQRREHGKLDTFELEVSPNHLIVYHTNAVDTLQSLSEKWFTPPSDLHRANSSNDSYQDLITDGPTNYDLPLSPSVRHVNVIYCWTRPADKSVSCDDIEIGFKVLKEFHGVGFFEVEVVRKLTGRTFKVRHEDSGQEDLEVEEVLRFHILWEQRRNISTV